MLLNKALCKIIIVWKQCAPRENFSRDFWRSVTATDNKSILSSSDAIGKFSTKQNFQGLQWQGMYDSAEVDKSLTHANSAKKL